MTKDEAINRFKGIKESFSISVAQSNFYPSKDIQDELCDIAIESLQTENEWIPCSERLPKVGQDVLFCDGEWTGEGYMREDGDWFQFRWSAFWRKEEVIAWMPLPKPYREDGEV